MLKKSENILNNGDKKQKTQENKKVFLKECFSSEPLLFMGVVLILPWFVWTIMLFKLTFSPFFFFVLFENENISLKSFLKI